MYTSIEDQILLKEAVNMKAYLDKSGCISCGLCVDICPEVFQMDDDGVAEVYVEDVPVEVEDAAVEAQDSCPVSVITVE